jgi:hypothetical protein
MKKSLRLLTVIVLSLVIPFAAGCAPFDLGSHESLSAWYAGSVDALEIDSIGIHALDGSASGRTVNQYVVQTPVLYTYHVVWSPMLLVAIPYYGIKSVTRDPSRGPPAIPESDAKDFR